MFLQHQSVNSWKRNMNKSTASRNPKKNTLPRSICKPEANDSISGEVKSQSSIISIKISNERDAKNVVIEWYRNYHNNKPFNDNYLLTGLNMSKRQSAGGGCRNIDIKRSYPCLKCKELNKTCKCAKYRNLYRNIYGPTTDETILVGMETLHNLVSSRCSDSDTSMKAVEGTVHQQREYPLESGAGQSGYNNHRRDNGRNENNDRRRMPRDDYNKQSRERDKYGGYPTKDYYCGSDEGNIELLELNKNQSQNRRKNEQEPRRDSRKSKGNSNGNGRNGNKSGGTNEYNENVRKQMLKDTFNKDLFEDDDAAIETPSVYSEISKFVSSDGITNDLHSDESRLSLESRYTVENSVSSLESKVTAQNPSPLVSDISNETLPDNVEHAENHMPDTELKKTCIAPPNSKYSFSNNPLFTCKQTDNGTSYSEGIAQKDINEQLAQRLEQDNNFKHTLPNNIERNSINRSSNGLAKQVPCSRKLWDHQKNTFEQEQIEESDTTSSEEKKCDTPEESDSTENLKSSTQLYTCFVNPINNVQTIPIMSKSVVPVWDREKPYPTVHFISSTRNLRAGADEQKPASKKIKKHTDLVDYLLNPMRYVNKKETDSLRRSKSDSSLSVSSVQSAPRLFSEAATNTIHQETFSMTENKFVSPCSQDEWGNRVYIYDTGQTYLPTAQPEHNFANHNNIGEILCYPVEFNNKPPSESTRNGSVSMSGETFSVEVSDDENTDMSFSSASSNICTNSIHEENDVPQYDDDLRDLTEYDDAVENIEHNQHENKTEVSLQSENRQDTIGDIWKSPSNKSMKQRQDNGSIMDITVISLSSLGSSSIIKSSTPSSCSDTSISENNTELLREMNVIANDKTDKQVLTPIQEETEISDTESSFTENETNLIKNTEQPKLSMECDTVEKDNVAKTSLKQSKSKLSTHATVAIDNISESTKEDIDEMQENIDKSECSQQTVSHTDEIITIKQPSKSFDIESTVYSPVPTTCSCFTVANDDDDDTIHGKKKDKQINTTPVRIKTESKSQQTDPVKLRPIKSKVDTSSEFTTTASTRTTAAATDSVSVRRSTRRSTGTMSKSRKSSTKDKSVKFEKKSSKEDAKAKEVTNECLDSVTAGEEKSRDNIIEDMGDTIKSEPRLQKRNLQPRETRYAIARITKYDEFTTYEILKSTRAKPRIIPLTTEGVFTVRNRKKRKFKL